MDVSFRKRFTRSYISNAARKPEERLPTVTGADARLSPQGDLEVNPSGDISVLTGAECIIKGLLRRLGTPALGYPRLVRSAQGLHQVDADYFNGVYSYLSGPLTQANLSNMRSALRQSARQDGRIEIIDVTAGPFNYASNKVELQITYRIKSGADLQTLNLAI